MSALARGHSAMRSSRGRKRPPSTGEQGRPRPAPGGVSGDMATRQEMSKQQATSASVQRKLRRERSRRRTSQARRWGRQNSSRQQAADSNSSVHISKGRQTAAVSSSGQHQQRAHQQAADGSSVRISKLRTAMQHRALQQAAQHEQPQQARGSTGDTRCLSLKSRAGHQRVMAVSAGRADDTPLVLTQAPTCQKRGIEGGQLQ